MKPTLSEQKGSLTARDAAILVARHRQLLITRFDATGAPWSATRLIFRRMIRGLIENIRDWGLTEVSLPYAEWAELATLRLSGRSISTDAVKTACRQRAGSVTIPVSHLGTRMTVHVELFTPGTRGTASEPRRSGLRAAFLVNGRALDIEKAGGHPRQPVERELDRARERHRQVREVQDRLREDVLLLGKAGLTRLAAQIVVAAKRSGIDVNPIVILVLLWLFVATTAGATVYYVVRRVGPGKPAGTAITVTERRGYYEKWRIHEERLPQFRVDRVKPLDGRRGYTIPARVGGPTPEVTALVTHEDNGWLGIGFGVWPSPAYRKPSTRYAIAFNESNGGCVPLGPKPSGPEISASRGEVATFYHNFLQHCRAPQLGSDFVAMVGGQHHFIVTVLVPGKNPGQIPTAVEQISGFIDFGPPFEFSDNSIVESSVVTAYTGWPVQPPPPPTVPSSTH